MIGEPAPNFTLKNTSKEDVSLKDFSGKCVILAFYPGALQEYAIQRCAHSKIIQLN